MIVRVPAVRKTTHAKTNADVPATPSPTVRAVAIAKRPKIAARAIRSTAQIPANVSPAPPTIRATIRVRREPFRQRTDAKRTPAPRMTTALPAIAAKTAERKAPNASRAAKTNNAAAMKENSPTEQANAYHLVYKDWFAAVKLWNSVATPESSASIPARLNQVANRAKSIRNVLAPMGMWLTATPSAYK